MSTPCRLLVLILLIVGWEAKSPTLAFSQAMLPGTIEAGQSSEKENLEIARLRAEIEKVGAEAEKLRGDKITSWIAPAASVLSVLISVLILNWTLVSQRETAMQVQREQGRHALELKIADFIMSSRSPAMAEQRAELLSSLSADGVSSRFLETVITHAKAKDFPGDIGYDLRTKFFEATAAKYDAPSDVAELARRIFADDKWLKGDLTPPKTVVQPASTEKTAG